VETILQNIIMTRGKKSSVFYRLLNVVCCIFFSFLQTGMQRSTQKITFNVGKVPRVNKHTSWVMVKTSNTDINLMFDQRLFIFVSFRFLLLYESFL